MKRATLVACLSESNSKIKMALWLEENGIKSDSDSVMEVMGQFIKDKNNIHDLLD